MKIIFRQIALPPDSPEQYAVERAVLKAKAAGLHVHNGTVTRVSVDSRKKSDIKKVYSVLLECTDNNVKKISDAGAELYSEPALNIPGRRNEKSGKVAVIGFGPAGMFASLVLAENGFPVVVYERGKSVRERDADINAFLETRILDTESNIQFGAGGAGAYSDGKLITRINDPACNYVLKRLVQFGAPADILTAARPHIGTDLLKTVIENITSYLTGLGADIRFRTAVRDIKPSENGLIIADDSGEEYYDAAVLAVGHSARDTYRMLYERGVTMEKKPFSVGCRIEHLCEDIDRAMYGEGYDRYFGHLPHAEYNLSDRSDGRGVYSFCMCPGGKVICASSEEGGVVTNGMSYHKRDGKNSNSAIAVSVLPTDLSSDLFSGVEFQRMIERTAFTAAGGGYAAPCQTVGSLLYGKHNVFSKITPSYEPEVASCDLRKLFPDFIMTSLINGLHIFEKKISGFSSEHAVLIAPETRTSSPLRIIRGSDGSSPDMTALFPCGEGAGYAGGITSAAADGINTAIHVMEKIFPDLG